VRDFFGIRVCNLWSQERSCTRDEPAEQYKFKIFCPRLASAGLVGARPIYISGFRSRTNPRWSQVTRKPSPESPTIILFIIPPLIQLSGRQSHLTKKLTPRPTEPTSPSASSSLLEGVGSERGGWRRSGLFVIEVWRLHYRGASARMVQPNRPGFRRRELPR
jgi:hypothetical protein